ncbi:MazG-related protein [Photobacterium sp. TY1-4]|uniref:MazG-related protein n=1 Tax=Photobacterium sp. TY1-4 TaxID=2899122 RepID=UPI0021C187FF|nr:MazG-related protein [Photobacterium sp. TY1-4]UXI03434.1 MazG-related protein [Photobacterium sp. TY1-4]
MSEQVKTALRWIKAILEQENIPYQIVGGLAANIHGGSREVADIDLYIPKSQVNNLLPHAGAYISKPLAHYVEECWDLEYFQLIYHNQKIEIGLLPGTKIRAAEGDTWFEVEANFEQSVPGSYDGVVVPVMPVVELVAYKKVLGREVDLIDIAELSGK